MASRPRNTRGCARPGVGPVATAPQRSAYPLLVGAAIALLIAPSPVAAKRLNNREIGYALTYPEDWSVEGQIVATDFAQGARCQSVEVVDSKPPPGAGSMALVLHAFVQLCAKGYPEGQSLDDFMIRTYGSGFEKRFDTTRIGTTDAYRARKDDAAVTLFLQTDRYRLQVVSGVNAEPAMLSLRRSQVEEILKSLSIRTPVEER